MYDKKKDDKRKSDSQLSISKNPTSFRYFRGNPPITDNLPSGPKSYSSSINSIREKIHKFGLSYVLSELRETAISDGDRIDALDAVENLAFIDAVDDLEYIVLYADDEEIIERAIFELSELDEFDRLRF